MSWISLWASMIEKMRSPAAIPWLMLENWSMNVRTGRVICENMAMKAMKPSGLSASLNTSEPPNTRMTPTAEMPRNSLIGEASCWRRAIERVSRARSSLRS